MRILVDTNVVLDVLLDRRPFSDLASQVFALAEESKVEGFLCATTITTVDYLLCQSLASDKARGALQQLLSLFEIAPVNRAVLEHALRSKISDFEDAVMEEAGCLAGVDAIVTRNVADFRRSKIAVFDPAELIAVVKGAGSESQRANRSGGPRNGTRR